MSKVAELIILTGKLKHDNELFIELEKHPYKEPLLNDIIIAAEELKKKLKIKEKEYVKIVIDNGTAIMHNAEGMKYKDVIDILEQSANTLKNGIDPGKLGEVIK